MTYDEPIDGKTYDIEFTKQERFKIQLDHRYFSSPTYDISIKAMYNTAICNTLLRLLGEDICFLITVV